MRRLALTTVLLGGVLLGGGCGSGAPEVTSRTSTTTGSSVPADGNANPGSGLDTTGSSSTTTTTVTLSEACQGDDDLERLLGVSAPYVAAAQDRWEAEGGLALGCFVAVVHLKRHRLIEFLDADGRKNATFSLDEQSTRATPVYAPFTGEVAAVAATGQVSEVGERLVAGQAGVAVLVGLEDQSCRLILALSSPFPSDPPKLAATFDDFQSSLIITQAHSVEATSVVAQEQESGAITVELTGPGGEAALTFNETSASIGGFDVVRDPSAGPTPCPFGWWDESFEAIEAAGD